MSSGLLMLAHGARDPAWAVPFKAVLGRVRSAEPALPAALAYLEFMTPDLVSAGEVLADTGCTRIDVVPLFLGAGGHVRKDVPALIERLRASRPGVTVTLHRAAGEAPAVIAALADAALAATRA